jgi:hypothetical protein
MRLIEIMFRENGAGQATVTVSCHHALIAKLGERT